MDGFGYAHIDFSATAANLSDQEAFFGLNLVRLGSAYNKGTLIGINDPNESEIGGEALFHTPAGIFPCALDPNQPLACTDFIGTAEIEANSQSALLLGGNSPWVFRSNDPFENRVAVPEPGTLALLSVAMLGIALSRRKT